MVGLTGQRLSSKALLRWRRLGNRNANIPTSLGSWLARTPGSRPVKPKQANKKYPKGIFSLTWWGLINQALTDYEKDMKEELRDMLAT